MNDRYLLLDGAAVLAMMEDHHPEIGSWVDDSTWLECSCGWDSSKPKAVDWHQHLIDAVTASSAVGSAVPDATTASGDLL